MNKMFDEQYEDNYQSRKLFYILIKTLFFFINILIIVKIYKTANSPLLSLKHPINNSKFLGNYNQQINASFNLAVKNMGNFTTYSYFGNNVVIEPQYLKVNYYKVINMNYFYSTKFQKMKLDYMIGFFDENKTLIKPSDLRLYEAITLICYMELENQTTTKIFSMGHIFEDKYYHCIEFFNITEKPKFGIYFYEQKYLLQMFDFMKYVNLSDIRYEYNLLFDPKYLEKQYNKIIDNVDNSKFYFLLMTYLKRPSTDYKRNIAINDNIENFWVFRNYYNNYFCFCVGENCLFRKIKQRCKFKLYKDIIYKNRNLYPKTDYIFVDFIFKKLPSDDTFPIFQEMIKQNYSAHYITEKREINDLYCNNTIKCLTIIPMYREIFFMYGDFLEKYLSLILKLKAVVSCKPRTYHYLSLFFFQVGYINYIAVGHGVNYFKGYLFNKYRMYGYRKNNQILVPPSKILVNISLQHGWKNKDIIKINLPRWDRYANVSHYFPGNITNNSILIMFTWRNTKIWPMVENITELYHENIIRILQNERLHKVLKEKKMIMYFSLHRFSRSRYTPIYKEVAATYNETLIKLKQNQISECLAKTNLVVSDFSSIIFDLMSRGKPFIIYVPDSEDNNISDYYTKDYVDLIEGMKSGRIQFKNKANTINETVDKIIYYINKDFKLEPELKQFYNEFNFTYGNNTKQFMDYLLHME